MMKAALLIVALTFTSAATAQRLPVPLEQQTPQARVWLSRAMIGEAGWMQHRAHVGIAWVLARRWYRQIERWPAMRFETVIKNYAHALGFRAKGSLSKRHIWLRGLLGNEQPKGWPSRHARWDRHLGYWRGARERTDRFFAGKLRDPCKGAAWNWGGFVDISLAKAKRLNPVDCGDTGRTTFYDDGTGD